MGGCTLIYPHQGQNWAKQRAIRAYLIPFRKELFSIGREAAGSYSIDIILNYILLGVGLALAHNQE